MFMQWLQDHAGYAIVAALLIIWKGAKPVYSVVTGYFAARSEIHATDALLSTGYERRAVLADAQRDKALKENARLIQKVSERDGEIEVLKYINKQDRLTRSIYLKHLRANNADIAAIEREVRADAERQLRNEYE